MIFLNSQKEPVDVSGDQLEAQAFSLPDGKTFHGLNGCGLADPWPAKLDKMQKGTVGQFLSAGRKACRRCWNAPLTTITKVVKP